MGLLDDRIALRKPEGLRGEASRFFDERKAEGFWDRFVRPGPVVDVGHKGADQSAPIFKGAIAPDVDTRGYDGLNLPFESGAIGTIHARHVLEHIADYSYYLRECLRALTYDGTLIIFVPLMEAYEGKRVPPSRFNEDHKRFYTSMRLLFEIESSLPRGLSHCSFEGALSSGRFGASARAACDWSL